MPTLEVVKASELLSVLLDAIDIHVERAITEINSKLSDQTWVKETAEIDLIRDRLTLRIPIDLIWGTALVKVLKLVEKAGWEASVREATDNNKLTIILVAAYRPV